MNTAVVSTKWLNEFADLKAENARLREALEHIANPDLVCDICKDHQVQLVRHYENIALEALKARDEESG